MTGLSHGDFPAGLWKASDPGNYRVVLHGGEAVQRLGKSSCPPAELEAAVPPYCAVCRVMEGRGDGWVWGSLPAVAH